MRTGARCIQISRTTGAVSGAISELVRLRTVETGKRRSGRPVAYASESLVRFNGLVCPSVSRTVPVIAFPSLSTVPV